MPQIRKRLGRPLKLHKRRSDIAKEAEEHLDDRSQQWGGGGGETGGEARPVQKYLCVRKSTTTSKDRDDEQEVYRPASVPGGPLTVEVRALLAAVEEMHLSFVQMDATGHVEDKKAVAMM